MGPTTSLRPTGGAPWPLTGPGRLRIASSLILLWVWPLDRSRLELPAGRRGSPSTTSCLGSRRSSAATLSSPGRSSVILSKMFVLNVNSGFRTQLGHYFLLEHLHLHPKLHLQFLHLLNKVFKNIYKQGLFNTAIILP